MGEVCRVREWSSEAIIGKTLTVHHIWLFAPITGCKWQWMAEFSPNEYLPGSSIVYSVEILG